MGEPIVDLLDAGLWNLAYNQTTRAGNIAGGYIPLLPFELPTLFTSPILLVEAEYLNAKPWWYLGCRLQQRIDVAISPGAALGRFQTVPVNRPSLIRLPMYAAQYSLVCEVPPWFDRLKLSVWEYSGSLGDSTEALIQESTDTIRIDLLRLEAKINQINGVS